MVFDSLVYLSVIFMGDSSSWDVTCWSDRHLGVGTFCINFNPHHVVTSLLIELSLVSYGWDVTDV